jgi:hypothetical protein
VGSPQLSQEARAIAKQFIRIHDVAFDPAGRLLIAYGQRHELSDAQKVEQTSLGGLAVLDPANGFAKNTVVFQDTNGPVVRVHPLADGSSIVIIDKGDERYGWE